MSDKKRLPVHITKETTDPVAIRISAGGLRNKGHYIVYRGDLEEVINCLDDILIALTGLKKTVEHNPNCEACADLRKDKSFD